MLARELSGINESGPNAVILGGEPAVDTRNQTGIGGPMLELGLSAAVSLDKAGFDWTVLSMTSDGIDGPSRAAGMVCTRSMIRDPDTVRAIRDSISSHDSRPMCDTLNACVTTGPTGTNVNDLAILIRWDTESNPSQNNCEKHP